MARLDVRLDAERRRRLEEVVTERGVPISDVVRDLIDEAYEAVMRQRRIQAVERLVGLEVEDVPDPATLSRQLEAAHDLGDVMQRLGSDRIVSADTDFDGLPGVTRLDPADVTDWAAGLG